MFFSFLICLFWASASGLNFLQRAAKSSTLDLKKKSLSELVCGTGKNGNQATSSQRKEIRQIVQELKKLNPTRNPTSSALLTTQPSAWRLSYTDFDPPAPSSGRLGPFTGDVYQYLDPQRGRIKNLLRIELPFKCEVFGGLIARQSVLTGQTWKIDFDYVTNGINIIDGRVRLGGKRKYFESNECRLWKHCYLDEDLRILEARKEEANEDDAFIFITNRVTDIPLPVEDI